MTFGVMIFAVLDILILAAYCWFYEPKHFYGGFPAELWQEPERTQEEKARTEVAAELLTGTALPKPP